MTRPKILLDPDDFDALHLSALEFGGIGSWHRGSSDAPHCKLGHASNLGSGMNARLMAAGLTTRANDGALDDAGVGREEKIPFERYIQILNIDIKESK